MKPLLTAFFLSLTTLLNAQVSEDIFDDGTVTDPFGTVQADLLSVLSGEALVGFEYYFGGRGAVALYAGPRIGDYRPGLMGYYVESQGGEPYPWATEGGFSYVLETRVYYDTERRGLFSTLTFHNRLFRVPELEDRLRSSDVGFGIGRRIRLGGRLFGEGNFRVGYQFTNDAYDRRGDPTGPEPIPGGTILAHANVRVGYEF